MDADVVIVGAGMVGASLALALAAGGLEVILVDPQTVEAQTAASFDGRASAISFAAFRQWRRLGLADDLEPKAQRIEQIVVTDGQAPGLGGGGVLPAFLRFDAREIAADIGDRTDGEALGYMLENRDIRAALGAAVLERAGVAVLAPAEVVEVAFGAARATARLADGRMLRAPLIVAADGRASPTRRQAGIGVIGWDYTQVGVVATVALERDHGGVAYEHFLPAGPFAILPLTGRRASLVWTESRAAGAALKTARPELFAAHLRRRFGDFLGTVQPVGPRFTYPLSLQLADRIAAPRLALIGDAAHAIHPIAGQGLNLGLKDVATLAQVLVDAARLGEDLGAELVLERYARWRRLDTVALAAATDLFDRLFSTDRAPIRLARGLGMALVNRIGPARRFFMREAGGAVGHLPRLLKGEAL